MQLRSHLLKDDRFVAIGKASTYALAEWDSVYTGSIRDRICEILESEDEPVHISRIVEDVKKVYPDTNRNSLMASIGSDTLGRFVEFEGKRYGLKSKSYPDTTLRIADNHRITVSEKLDMLESFIEKNHHRPSIKAGAEEAYPARSIYNITAMKVDSATLGELKRLKTLLDNAPYKYKRGRRAQATGFLSGLTA